MKVIGLVTVCLVLGEGFLQPQQENLYNFAIHKITGGFGFDGLFKDRCANSVAEEAVKQFGNTFTFISDEHLHEKLLRTLQSNFMYSYYTEPDNLSSFNSQLFYDLVIFGKKIELKEVIKKKPLQSSYFLLYVKNHQEAINTFEILWESRLVNVVATYVNDTTAYFYTYFPYCSTHCGRVGNPYLLAKCDITTGIFSQRQKLFPRKVFDLHKCPISITLTENIPASYYTATNELTGWEVELLNEILERVNGVPKYIMLPYSKRVYRRIDGYQSLVENSEIGGGLVISLRGLTKTDFCMYGMSLCATWIAPRRDGIPSADFLIKEFSPTTWLLVFLTYFVLAVVITIRFKLNLGNVLFKLLPYLLGTTTRTRKTSRILGALWLFFCLIINAVYQGRFQSALVVPNDPQQFSTEAEILKSDLKLLGARDLITDTFPYYQRRYNLSNKRFIKSRRLSYKSISHRMYVRKNFAYLGFKEVVRFATEKTELASKIYIQETCRCKYLLGFVLKKNSHLTDTVVKFSNKMNENGFLSYFFRKYLSKDSWRNIPRHLKGIVKPLSGACHAQTPPVNMDKIFVVFLCFTAGISFAFVVFLLELISKWNWDKLKKIKGVRITSNT